MWRRELASPIQDDAQKREGQVLPCWVSLGTGVELVGAKPAEGMGFGVCLGRAQLDLRFLLDLKQEPEDLNEQKEHIFCVLQTPWASTSVLSLKELCGLLPDSLSINSSCNLMYFPLDVECDGKTHSYTGGQEGHPPSRATNCPNLQGFLPSAWNQRLLRQPGHQ